LSGPGGRGRTNPGWLEGNRHSTHAGALPGAKLKKNAVRFILRANQNPIEKGKITMNKNINTTTSVHIVSSRRNGEPASELSEIRFGTLRVSPIAVIVSTKSDTEDPENYALADKTFEHVRASLILFAKAMEADLGNDWKIMIEDGE
jgi:hypothetical protein